MMQHQHTGTSEDLMLERPFALPKVLVQYKSAVSTRYEILPDGPVYFMGHPLYQLRFSSGNPPYVAHVASLTLWRGTGDPPVDKLNDPKSPTARTVLEAIMRMVAYLFSQGIITVVFGGYTPVSILSGENQSSCTLHLCAMKKVFKYLQNSMTNGSDEAAPRATLNPIIRQICWIQSKQSPPEVRLDYKGAKPEAIGRLQPIDYLQNWRPGFAPPSHDQPHLPRAPLIAWHPHNLDMNLFAHKLFVLQKDDGQLQIHKAWPHTEESGDRCRLIYSTDQNRVALVSSMIVTHIDGCDLSNFSEHEVIGPGSDSGRAIFEALVSMSRHLLGYNYVHVEMENQLIVNAVHPHGSTPGLGPKVARLDVWKTLENARQPLNAVQQLIPAAMVPVLATGGRKLPLTWEHKLEGLSFEQSKKKIQYPIRISLESRHHSSEG